MSDEECATLSATGGDFEQAIIVAAGASGARKDKFDLRTSFSRFVFGQHMLALIDQAIVSGASFLTTVLVGRGADSSELGIYAIGGSLLVSALMIQDSLIVLPYTIHSHEQDGVEAARSGSALTHNGMLSALGLLLLAAAVAGSSLFRVSSRFEPMIWALAGIMPFVLTRELCRRFAIAELNIMRALALDAAVAAIQLSSLGWLAETRRISAAAAFIAIGLASAAPAVAWLYIHRRDFAFGVKSIRADLKKNWRLGKWLMAGQLIVQIESYAGYWLSLAIIGAAGTGVFAACASVIAFFNPFISAFRNILTPRFVRAWRKGGSEALRAQAFRGAALLGAGAGAFCLIVSFFGGDLLRLLYRGAEYQGQSVLVELLALAMLATTMGLPASTALAAMQRPRLIVVAGAVGAAVTMALLWSLTIKWGLVGAGFGLFLGGLVGASGRWLAFLVVTSRLPGVDASVADVGKSMAVDCEFDSREIERIDEGVHAVIYAVRLKSAAPIAGEDGRLIIKMFKAEAAVGLEAARAQARALSRRHAAMDDKVVEGWRIVIPEILHVCVSPPAIVMTEGPGRSLFDWTKTGEGLTPDLLATIAAATVASMRKLWTRGEIHGDFALQNILCDASNKTLAFIDFGTKDGCAACGGHGARWSPGACDLSHLLSDVGGDVRRSIGARNARRLRRSFAAGALRAFLRPIGSLEERRRALDEIENCMWKHIDDLFDLSWSPRGLWRRHVKFTTVRRLAALLAEARAEVEAGERKPLNGGLYPAAREASRHSHETSEQHGT